MNNAANNGINNAEKCICNMFKKKVNSLKPIAVKNKILLKIRPVQHLSLHKAQP